MFVKKSNEWHQKYSKRESKEKKDSKQISIQCVSQQTTRA